MLNTQTHLIAIGIPTFNRKEYVKLCAESLCNAVNINSCFIFVLDDNSSEYDLNYLKKYFLLALKLLGETRKVLAQIMFLGN